MKEFILNAKEDENMPLEGSRGLLRESLQILQGKSADFVGKMKDTIFYFMILNMYKHSLLNRLYTEILENFLQGSLEKDAAPVDQDVIISKAKQMLNRYPMTSRPPGMCIIVAMTKNRESAEIDIANVMKVFETYLHFDTVVIRDPEKDDLQSWIVKLKANKYKFYDRYVRL